MAAIPIPSVNTPTYQSWASAVAGKLNLRYYVQITADGGAVGSTPLGIPGLGITFVVPTGPDRQIELDSFANVIKAGTQPSITRLSLRVDGAVVAESRVTFQNPPGQNAHRPGVVKSFPAGSHTLQVYLATDLDTANITASPTSPAWVSVKDFL